MRAPLVPASFFHSEAREREAGDIEPYDTLEYKAVDGSLREVLVFCADYLMLSRYIERRAYGTSYSHSL